MNSTTLIALALSTCSLASLAGLVATESNGGSPSARPARDDSVAASPVGGIVTLYGLNPVASCIQAATGNPGRVIVDGVPRARGADLLYHVPPDAPGDYLVFGLTGGSEASVCDLGDPRFPGTESSCFDAIVVRDGKLTLTEEARELRLWLGTLLPQGEFESAPHVRPELGHIYAARITNVAVGGTLAPQGEDIFLVVRVLAHMPREFIALRWRAMPAGVG